MQTSNWFRTHRRQVVIHASVIVGFLLFTLVAAEPLFDRLERIPGEAQLQRISLPAEAGDIHCGIDELSTIARAVVEVSGWAFIQGYDVDLDETSTYVVLKSESRTYVFDTWPRERPDVTAHFEELGLNLDWAGFVTNIPLRLVASGEYTIGIYIRTGDVEALQYTTHTLEL